MHIDTTKTLTVEQLRAELAKMDSLTLLAQELTQKGALHSLQTLERIGVTAENVALLLNSLQRHGLLISAECKRRGIPVVDHPSGN